jgi:biotin-dependent carboxylase-like uncharacterized protein
MSLRVLEPGLYALVVDFGRARYRSMGVPAGGAADRGALAVGNALVGNPPDAAALEISLAGPTLRADCDLACVVFGAPFVLSSSRQNLVAGKTFTLAAGEELHIGATNEGVRAYFCVRGGLQVPEILGSRTALEALTAGAVLECSGGIIHGRFLTPDRDTAPTMDQPLSPLHSLILPFAAPMVLRVLEGPQAGWFRGHEFYSQAFTVTPAANRMGLRLSGRALTLPERELVSEPVCPGSVQVTRDGQCIILGVDGQTIGGYPKIAQVISADLDVLGQLRPGNQIRFSAIELAEAESAWRERQKRVRELVTRLQVSRDALTCS